MTMLAMLGPVFCPCFARNHVYTHAPLLPSRHDQPRVVRQEFFLASHETDGLVN